MDISQENMEQINAFGERFKERFPDVELMMIIPLFMIIDAKTWTFPDYIRNLNQTKEILDFIEHDEELKDLFQRNIQINKIQ